MGELEAGLLRHRLYLKGQDAQLVEYGLHAVGQHAQILRTAEHPRLSEGLREPLERLAAPEEVMTLVIVIVVEPHEGILLFGRQCIVDRLVVDPDARVIHLRLFGIFEEEHPADEPIEPVTNPETVLITQSLEMPAHLPLRIVFSLQVVETITARNQEMLLHIGRMNAEQPFEHAVVYKRTGEEILAERETEVLNLADGHRECRGEMPQEPEYRIARNLPDAEETQYMIDTDRIEVLLHPKAAAAEPGGQFLAPPIGWEAPVLTILRERIRRGTRLRFQVEELRMETGLGAVAIDTDGYIALDDDTLLTGIIGCSLQLQMEVILDVIDQTDRHRLARMADCPLGV